MTDVPARPASTVVLLRPSDRRFEVLLMRRHDQVAFMGGAHVFPGGRVDDSDRADDPAMRHRLAAVRELQEEAAISLGVDALTPFAHWVTPAGELKRFDTWFFVALVPPDQVAVHDGTEHDDSIWVDPAEAIEMARRGEILLPPPTWMTLRRMAEFERPEDVLAWARTVDVVRIQPELRSEPGMRIVTVPGTPAAVFVLRGGRWRESTPEP